MNSFLKNTCAWPVFARHFLRKGYFVWMTMHKSTSQPSEIKTRAEITLIVDLLSPEIEYKYRIFNGLTLNMEFIPRVKHEL